jgi:hypothetical protein
MDSERQNEEWIARQREQELLGIKGIVVGVLCVSAILTAVFGMAQGVTVHTSSIGPFLLKYSLSTFVAKETN